MKSESEVAQSCPTLSNSMDCSPPGSSVQGIFQARVLEWVAIAFSGCLVAKLFQFFCDSMDCNPPGSSVHGILQARMLEWVAILFSRGLPNPGTEFGSRVLQANSKRLSGTSSVGAEGVGTYCLMGRVSA